MKQHPLYYILASLAGVLLAAGLLELITENWHQTRFWQSAALSFLAIIASLSVDLFRRVSRMYPLLRCFGNSGKSNHSSNK